MKTERTEQRELRALMKFGSREAYDTVSEWPGSRTRNPLGSARRGFEPHGCQQGVQWVFKGLPISRASKDPKSAQFPNVCSGWVGLRRDFQKGLDFHRGQHWESSQTGLKSRRSRAEAFSSTGPLKQSWVFLYVHLRLTCLDVTGMVGVGGEVGTVGVVGILGVVEGAGEVVGVVVEVVG